MSFPSKVCYPTVALACLMVLTSWLRLVGLAESLSGMSSTCLQTANAHEVVLPLSKNESSSNRNDNSISINSSEFDHEICILTMTGASNHEARQCQRETCRLHEYETFGIVHRFAVGMPSFDMANPANHLQGKVGTRKEVAVAEMLLEEYDEFGDILMTPHRDRYRDLSEKRLAILKYGVENKCRYTFKVDDEFCMNVTVARELIAAHEQKYPNAELYIGYAMFKGTEYPNRMTGPHGEQAPPYMSGWLNGVSNKLSSFIVREDWAHSVLRFAYGTSSEDLNLGHWVDYAIQKHNVSVNFVKRKTILYKRRICEDA